ncbi:MAG: hypothetical protein H6667_03025 [Ardenticatenaceae bacterium]|nr:hypothetical protein [Ardenticatenaceae bacterium]MCB9442982.1 hypothetical protein [Ardenticatenaceae bacterium]
MNISPVSIIFGLATVYFGGKIWHIIPTFFKLTVALLTGIVKWPGPRIHDFDRRASLIRKHLGAGYENLFPTFILNALGVLGAFIFSILTLISSTQSMSGYIRINWTFFTVVLTLFAFIGGEISFKKAQKNILQVKSILSDHAKKVEPKAVDSQSTETEYAIEHPLIGYRNLPSNTKRAMDLFYESTRHHQDGNVQTGLILYKEALKIDPNLHKNARESLLKMAQNCNSSDEGAIFYWLGIHSVYLMDRRQAAIYYEKAIDAFNRIGYLKRESRARCNLGDIKMGLGDPSGMEEFEKAVALNPKNGTAYINIGVTYYRISEHGDPRFEKALDAFANAIIADPDAYKPLVLSQLRSIGYTWREDWEDIVRRVVSRTPGTRIKSDPPAKNSDALQTSPKKEIGFTTNPQILKLEGLKGSQKRPIGFRTPAKKSQKTYRNEKHGFEIDIPVEWAPAPIPKQGGKDLFQYGCYDEAFNFEIGPLFPEPPLEQTERDFMLFAMVRRFSGLKIGRIAVGGKEHVCASYFISDGMGDRWNKKYMIVFDKTEYAITATCNDQKWFAQREKDWDAIIQSFRMVTGFR